MLKVLRQHDAETTKFGTVHSTVLTAEGVESHRAEATGLFNHLYLMLQSRLITPDLFAMVISPRAAELWLTLVAPLDRQVRLQGAKPGDAQYDPGEHPIEVFYAKYAETGGVLLRVPTATTPGAETPAPTH